MTTRQLPTPPRTGPGTGRSILWRYWPDVLDGARPPVFAAAGTAAAATVLTEPYAVVGAAGLLTGLAVCAGPVAVGATNRATRRRLLRPLPVLAGVAGVGLLAVGAVRSAVWLYALCVLAAFGLGSYAIAGGTRWPGVLTSTVVTWAASLRGIPWLTRGATARSRSASGRSRGNGETERDRSTDTSGSGECHGGTVRGRSSGGDPSGGVTVRGRFDGVMTAWLRGLAVFGVTVVLLAVFGALFAGADAAFASILGGLLPEFDAETLLLRSFMAGGAAVLTLGAAFAARVPPRTDRLAGSGSFRVRPVEWAVPAGALVVLFAGFVAVQFAVLFGGDEHVQLTSGLTYAEYARSGFGHLVVVTLLTLAVLAAIARLAPRHSARDRLLARVVGGALCVLTLVIVASALYRMHLYQEAYGFTRQRLLVTVFESWFGLLFLLVLAAGARLRGGWLPRAVVGTAAAAVLGLAVANPDALIAERNVARYEQTGRIDVQYLSWLSSDAAPVLDRLPEPLRSCALGPTAEDLERDQPWYAHPLADYRADRLITRNPVQEHATC